MKFCPVVPAICCGQVHGPRKERKKEKKNNNNNINNNNYYNNNNKKRSKNNKSPNVVCNFMKLGGVIDICF
jgi:hypothetical protein